MGSQAPLHVFVVCVWPCDFGVNVAMQSFAAVFFHPLAMRKHCVV